MTEEEFKQCFRFTRDTFKGLLGHMQLYISRYGPEDEEKELIAHQSGRDVQAAVKLAVFLRMMAGGIYWDLALAFNLGRSTVHKIFALCLVATDSVLELQDYPAKGDVDGFKEIAKRFATSRKTVNPLPGCIGAVDGICVSIQKPRRSLNPLKFYCRKGFFAVPVQAAVDHCYRFVAVSIICAGATNDRLCLRVSNIGEYIRKGLCPLGFWIAGDDAYDTFERLLTPICRLTATVIEDAFNYFQSSHRVHVEQAFGYLKNKWGILWRPLKFNLARANLIIKVSMKLQNYSINNDSEIPHARKHPHSVAKADRELEQWLRWYNGDEEVHASGEVDNPCASQPEMMEDSIRCRRLLVEVMRRSGQLRPDPSGFGEREITKRQRSILEVHEEYDF